MALSEQQHFVNALRAVLGLAPLYGADVSYGGIETVEDPLGHSRGDDWFEAAAPEDKSTRNERWSRTVEVAQKKLMKNAKAETYAEMTKRKTDWRKEKQLLREE
jgi:hypothetical protein